MSKERLGARTDFDEWAGTVVATVKKHRRRLGGSPDASHGRNLLGLRRWATRIRTKIAD
ncbi:MAG TPA: hypothetical protein VFU33_04530 [Gaiellaceae bacterium]|nr:hypothetical protein [Gaiellaceae bacterium]